MPVAKMTDEQFVERVRETVEELKDPAYNDIGRLNLQAWIGERAWKLVEILDEKRDRIEDLEAENANLRATLERLTAMIAERDGEQFEDWDDESDAFRE